MIANVSTRRKIRAFHHVKDKIQCVLILSVQGCKKDKEKDSCRGIKQKDCSAEPRMAGQT